MSDDGGLAECLGGAPFFGLWIDLAGLGPVGLDRDSVTGGSGFC